MSAHRFYTSLLKGGIAPPYWDWNPRGASAGVIDDEGVAGLDMLVVGGSPVPPQVPISYFNYARTGIHNFSYAHCTDDTVILSPRSTVVLYFHSANGFVVGTHSGWLAGHMTPAFGSGGNDHKFTVGTDGKFRATIRTTASASPGNTDVTVVSTTVVAAGTGYCVGMTHDGSSVKLWVNGVVEDSETALGDSVLATTPRYFIVGGGQKPFSSQEPMADITTGIGRVVAAPRGFTDAEMTILYAQYRAQYAGLP